MKVSNLDKLHSDYYPVALQMAKKFTDGKHSLRPVLTYVLHDSNGDMVATDSHRLLLVKGVHGFKEQLLIKPDSFDVAHGDYPDTKNIIPSEEKEPVITLNKDQLRIWSNAHKTLKSISKVTKENRVKMDLGESKLSLISGGNVEIKLPCKEYKRDENIDAVHYNVEYMADSLEALEKLNSEQVFIKLYGKYSPIILDNGTNVIALVLPIRVY